MGDFLPKIPGGDGNKKAIIFLFAVLLLVALPLILLGSSMIGDRLGEGTSDQFGGGSGAGGGGGGVSCSGVANVKAEYMPWVQDAANKYLKGDQAALIVLIEVESTWNPNATNKGNASGLGQFVYTTAVGMSYFVGGKDRAGMTWEPANVYKNSIGHSNDARFDPKRSIYASANYLGDKMQKYGDLRTAYEKGYHTYSNPSKYAEARHAGDKLMKIYDQLIKSGGCTVTEGAGGNISASCNDGKGSIQGVDPLASCRYRRAAAKTGGAWSVSQGLGNVAASAGFHLSEPGSKYTAAIDIGVNGKSKSEIESMVRNMRSEGWAAWLRSCTSAKGWCGREHIHGAYSGIPAKRGLERQEDDFVQGKDGTASHNKIDLEIPITNQEKGVVNSARKNRPI